MSRRCSKFYQNSTSHSTTEESPYVSVKSKLQHPPAPGHFTPLPSAILGKRELSESPRGWGIWSPCIGGGEFEPQPRFHVKSLGALHMAIYHGTGGVKGFSWKRLCLSGQLVTRKGLKQALCRNWRYLNFNIFNIGFRLWIDECIKLCLQRNIIPIPAIQYNNKKLNRGQ